MSDTLVLQSHRLPLPTRWLQRCLDSVQSWAADNSFEYRFADDALFEFVPKAVLEKTHKQRVIATDIARLGIIQHYLARAYSTVVWFDADFLIFNSKKLVLPNEEFALGREVWIEPQHSDKTKFIARVKVHNAFLMFRRGNSFLDFYRDSAERLLMQNSGPIPPQFIGPKLLTAIHNVVQCPVLETAGMLSPAVIHDLYHREGAALDLFRRRSKATIAGANLCHSLFERGEISLSKIEAVIVQLETHGVG